MADQEEPAAGVEVSGDGDARVLTVVGAVDLSAAGPLGRQLRDGMGDVRPGGVVTVDLTRTSYLASAGVGLLLELATASREQGIDIRVRTAPGTVPDRILALTGVAGLLARSG
jgi:anti-anti-sigma factor